MCGCCVGVGANIVPFGFLLMFYREPDKISSHNNQVNVDFLLDPRSRTTTTGSERLWLHPTTHDTNLDTWPPTQHLRWKPLVPSLK